MEDLNLNENQQNNNNLTKRIKSAKLEIIFTPNQDSNSNSESELKPVIKRKKAIINQLINEFHKDTIDNSNLFVADQKICIQNRNHEKVKKHKKYQNDIAIENDNSEVLIDKSEGINQIVSGAGCKKIKKKKQKVKFEVLLEQYESTDEKAIKKNKKHRDRHLQERNDIVNQQKDFKLGDEAIVPDEVTIKQSKKSVDHSRIKQGVEFEDSVDKKGKTHKRITNSNKVTFDTSDLKDKNNGNENEILSKKSKTCNKLEELNKSAILVEDQNKKYKHKRIAEFDVNNDLQEPEVQKIKKKKRKRDKWDKCEIDVNINGIDRDSHENSIEFGANYSPSKHKKKKGDQVEAFELGELNINGIKRDKDRNLNEIEAEDCKPKKKKKKHDKLELCAIEEKNLERIGRDQQHNLIEIEADSSQPKKKKKKRDKLQVSEIEELNIEGIGSSKQENLVEIEADSSQPKKKKKKRDKLEVSEIEELNIEGIGSSKQENLVEVEVNNSQPKKKKKKRDKLEVNEIEELNFETIRSDKQENLIEIEADQSQPKKKKKRDKLQVSEIEELNVEEIGSSKQENLVEMEVDNSQPKKKKKKRDKLEVREIEELKIDEIGSDKQENLIEVEADQSQPKKKKKKRDKLERCEIEELNLEGSGSNKQDNLVEMEVDHSQPKKKKKKRDKLKVNEIEELNFKTIGSDKQENLIEIEADQSQPKKKKKKRDNLERCEIEELNLEGSGSSKQENLVEMDVDNSQPKKKKKKRDKLELSEMEELKIEQIGSDKQENSIEIGADQSQPKKKKKKRDKLQVSEIEELITEGIGSDKQENLIEIETEQSQPKKKKKNRDELNVCDIEEQNVQGIGKDNIANLIEFFDSKPKKKKKKEKQLENCAEIDEVENEVKLKKYINEEPERLIKTKDHSFDGCQSTVYQKLALKHLEDINNLIESQSVEMHKLQKRKKSKTLKENDLEIENRIELEIVDEQNLENNKKQKQRFAAAHSNELHSVINNSIEIEEDENNDRQPSKKSKKHKNSDVLKQIEEGNIRKSNCVQLEKDRDELCKSTPIKRDENYAKTTKKTNKSSKKIEEQNIKKTSTLETQNSIGELLEKHVKKRKTDLGAPNNITGCDGQVNEDTFGVEKVSKMVKESTHEVNLSHQMNRDSDIGCFDILVKDEPIEVMPAKNHPTLDSSIEFVPHFEVIKNIHDQIFDKSKKHKHSKPVDLNVDMQNNKTAKKSNGDNYHKKNHELETKKTKKPHHKQTNEDKDVEETSTFGGKSPKRSPRELTTEQNSQIAHNENSSTEEKMVKNLEKDLHTEFDIKDDNLEVIMELLHQTDEKVNLVKGVLHEHNEQHQELIEKLKRKYVDLTPKKIKRSPKQNTPHTKAQNRQSSSKSRNSSGNTSPKIEYSSEQESQQIDPLTPSKANDNTEETNRSLRIESVTSPKPRNKHEEKNNGSHSNFELESENSPKIISRSKKEKSKSPKLECSSDSEDYDSKLINTSIRATRVMVRKGPKLQDDKPLIKNKTIEEDLLRTISQLDSIRASWTPTQKSLFAKRREHEMEYKPIQTQIPTDVNSINDVIKAKDQAICDKIENLPSMIEVILPFSRISELHYIESRLGLSPSFEQRQQIEALGLKPKLGQVYTKQEDEMILNNWKHFCEVHNLGKDPTPFLCLKHFPKIFPSRRDKLNFVRFLAHGLPDRLLYSVYMRFKRLMRVNPPKRFTEAEDKIITDYMYATTSVNPFADLAKILNRTNTAVCKRYLLLTTDSTPITWNKRRIQDFIQKLLEVTGVENVQILKDREITNEEWTKFADQMSLPLKKLKRAWFYTIYTKLFSGGLQTDELRIKLINLLYDRKETEWRTIDWKTLAKEFDGITPSRLSKFLKDLTNYQVPHHLRENLPECLDYLKNVFLKEYHMMKRSIKPVQVNDISSLSKNA